MIDNKTIRKVIMLNKMLPGGGSPTYENREASGAVANFTTNVVMPFVKCECDILPIQEGTGTPSPSNPRPISGTDELTLIRTGANLFPFDTVSGTTYAEKSISLEASTYTLSLVASGNSSTQMRTIFQYTDNSYGGECLFNKDTREAKTVTLTKPVKALLFYAADTYPNSVGFTFEYSDIQLELGSTATTYEPYNAETYTIDLGQEIMGGTADVVGGEGEVTRVVITYDGTENWHSEGTNNFYVNSGRGSGVYYGEDKLLCSHFKSTYNSFGHNNNVYISATGNLNLQCDDITHTVDGIKTWCATQYANGTPLQICYELKTPTSFTFTGQPINSLLGVNNVYTDSGDTKVTYKYKTGEGGSTNKKYLPIFYDFYGKGCRHL